MEGWYEQAEAPNRPQRNCNPGDLEFGRFAASYGAVLETPLGSEEARFACFPDNASGWAALTGLLEDAAYSQLTVEAAVNKFAPPNENDSVGYSRDVCIWSQVQLTDIVGTVMGVSQ
jgi:hypothetical protein